MYNGSPNWFDLDLAFSHHEELLREAERERLASKFHNNPKRFCRLTNLALSWLGRWMVGLGYQLQQRHEKQLDNDIQEKFYSGEVINGNNSVTNASPSA